MTSGEVVRALEVVASPDRARALAWFFKTAPGQYGAGDQFVGVTVPEQRRVARQFRELPLDEIERLLESPIHGHRLTALFILVGQYQSASEKREVRSEEHRPTKQRIVRFYLKHRRFVNNWDLVDGSAPYILEEWLLRHGTLPTSSRAKRGDLMHGIATALKGPRNDLLKTLARSASIWERRIAMLSSAPFIRASRFDVPLRIAELLVHDSHDLIHKGVGWMLREVGNQNRAILKQFLDRHAATMPRTMLRYAIEKFPAAERQHYLGRSAARKSADQA